MRGRKGSPQPPTVGLDVCIRRGGGACSTHPPESSSNNNVNGDSVNTPTAEASPQQVVQPQLLDDEVSMDDMIAEAEQEEEQARDEAREEAEIDVGMSPPPELEDPPFGRATAKHFCRSECCVRACRGYCCDPHGRGQDSRRSATTDTRNEQQPTGIWIRLGAYVTQAQI